MKLKIATRKSKRVELAIKKMINEKVIFAEFTWEDVWDDIVHSPGCYECVYLIGRNSAVWGHFPCPASKIHGNVTLSIDDVPYLWLADEDLPIEGEILISRPSGEKYYLFEDERRLGEDLDGYLVEHGRWVVERSDLVHWETVREAGL